MTRLTVALCTYNRASYLRRTLASLAGQLPDRTRLLVVDNASTDETPDVVARFREAELHRNPENVGMFGNWNRALEMIDSEYGSIVHDDDEFEPGAVARLLSILESTPGAAFVHCGVTYIDAEGAVIGYPPLDHPPLSPGIDLVRQIARTGAARVCAPTVMFRTAAVRRAGRFREDLKLASDTDMWARLAMEGDVAFVRERLLRYRYHAGGGTSGVTIVTWAEESRRVQRSAALLLAARGGRERPAPGHALLAEGHYLARLALAFVVRFGVRSPGDAETVSELRRAGREGGWVVRVWVALLLSAPGRLALGALGRIGRAARSRRGSEAPRTNSAP
jgi:glycosyltransferase involved in cell wall biosynthesis